MKIRYTLFAVVLISILPVTATAEVNKYDVQQLRYHNHGGYYVQVKLRWKDSETGDTRQKGTDTNTSPGSIHIWDIDELKDGPAEGEEVWLRLNIQDGEKKSCRKDSTKFYYASGNGEKALFSSAGTTYNNNHCKIKCATNCSGSDE